MSKSLAVRSFFVACSLVCLSSSTIVRAQQFPGAATRFGNPRQSKPAGKKPATTKKTVPSPSSSTHAKPAPAAVSPPKTEESIDDSPKLRATIQHSETLPPLPPKYQAGSFYGAYGLPSPTGQREAVVNLRFQVPDWLAGKWERQQSHETQRIELPSNKELKPAGITVARAADVFGTYRDQAGQVWQIFSSNHASGEVDRGEYVDRHTVTKYNFEVIGSKTAVVEVRAFHLIVSKKTQRIVQSYQDEEFNTYTLVRDGLVKTDSSVKVFDGEGAPKLLTRSNSEEMRVTKFEQPPVR